MRLALAALGLALAGCFDFSALGPPPADLAAPGVGAAPGGGGDDAGACTGLEDCPAGRNCIAGVCRAAAADCAAHKAAWPSAGDGVYWLAPPSAPPRLAYCDMARGAALCTDTMGTHRGVTREGSSTAFTMTSVLSADGRACELWAVRAEDGFPLGVFEDVAGNRLDQCKTLGFVDDLAIGRCPYGTDAGYSDCGFGVSPLYAYGHACSNCMLNSGTFTHYVKMGPFTTGSVLSSADGSTRARCKTR